MAPQPLSIVKPDANVIIAPDALRMHAWLGMLAAEAIGTWSTVDAQLTKLLGTMLGAAWRPANAMFAELSSSTAQTAAIKGVAREHFKDRPREAEVFTAIMTAVASGWKRRNPLAHHLWGYSDDLDDALLLLDPRDDARFAIELSEAISANQKRWRNTRKDFRPREPDNRVDVFLPRDQVMVYRENDFEELIRDFSEIADTISHFSIFVGPAMGKMLRYPEVSALLDELEAQPLIAPSLRRLRERQKSAAQVQPPPLPPAQPAKPVKPRGKKGSKG